MQRKLIQTLKFFKNCQFFITTHSNHLLDLALEEGNLAIFTFTKSLPNGNHIAKLPVVEIDQVYGNDISPLNLLGVRKSSVFLSNCTIWVEGITDRLYLRRYLDIIRNDDSQGKTFKEDLHYSFVEYGGGNIVHFNFSDTVSEEEKINIDKICGKSFVVADKDTNKDKRHSELQEKLGDRFYVLRCREIENLLSLPVLKATIAEYEKRPVADIILSQTLSQVSYQNNSLGIYIDKNLQNKTRRGSYSTASKTISDKLNFCTKSLRRIKRKEDMSPEAIEIAEKMLLFIKEHNPS